MHLHDKVMNAAVLRVAGEDGRIWTLPGAADIKAKIKNAPVRYVLDDATSALAAQAGYSDQNRFDAFQDILRFPATRAWVEWSERGRVAELSRLGLADFDESSDRRGRAGALIEADESGRRGAVSVVWENAEGAPDLSPFSIDYDLDDPDFSQQAAANAYSVRVSDCESLSRCLTHACFRLRPAWSAYHHRYARTDRALKTVIASELSNIASDMVFVGAFFLILQARGALTLEPSNLARLNAARRAREKPELLDYVQVGLNLAGGADGGRASAGAGRTTPRLHHVCGHLVRRGATVFWRRAHMRGDPHAGAIRSRTIMVKGSAAASAGSQANAGA